MYLFSVECDELNKQLTQIKENLNKIFSEIKVEKVIVEK